MGGECAHTAKTGSDVSMFSPGDRVFWRSATESGHVFYGTLVRPLVGGKWVVDDGLDRPLRIVSEWRLTKLERFAPRGGGLIA